MASKTPCADCQTNEGMLEIRQRYLCPSCFQYYVTSKMWKRMESYRFKPGIENSDKGQPSRRRLLLPLSAGLSSLVLLQVLDSQLQKQLAKQNRTAYDLVVAHIELPGNSSTSWYTSIASRFNTHEFIPSIPLHEVFNLDPGLSSNLNALLPSLPTTTDSSTLLNNLYSSLTTPTSSSDLQTILLTRLLVSLATHHSCSAILFAQSDSTLASLTLSAVAKGRGSSAAELIADGPSSAYNGLTFIHPCRDLYKGEIELFARLVEPPLEAAEGGIGEESVKGVVSIKNMSIDEVMRRYVKEQGEKYPGVMANVVRTVGKLQKTSTTSELGRCVLCKGRLEEGDQYERLCYGCQRMREDIRVIT